MRYNKITKFDTANGPGIRTVLWLSGCDHHCKGCHNPETWNPCRGERFTDDTLKEILESIDSPFISGLTLSGGDPLYTLNTSGVSLIVSTIKTMYPYKSIWVYTGYTWEELLYLAYREYDLELCNILENIDVLVDGKFDITQKDISLPYCGSRNQRLIDVQRSLQSDKVILYQTT